MKVRELVDLLQDEDVDPDTEVIVDLASTGRCSLDESMVVLTYDGKLAIEV